MSTALSNYFSLTRNKVFPQSSIMTELAALYQGSGVGWHLSLAACADTTRKQRKVHWRYGGMDGIKCM